MSSEKKINNRAAGVRRHCDRTTLKVVCTGLVAIAALFLSACDSGSFGSDVGKQEALAPMAQITVIGSNEAVRSGAEVLLSAKDSEGRDSPVIDFKWLQTAGPSVSLIKRSNNAVSFTAPNESAALTFQLTVTDAEGDTATATQNFNVAFAPDSDDFLRIGARLNAIDFKSTNQFTVVATTQNGIAVVPGSTETVDFTVSVVHKVTYTGRDGAERIYLGPADTRSGQWKLSEGSTALTPTAFNNPRFSFAIPALDLDEINRPFQDAAAGSARDGILDLDQVDFATSEVTVTLDIPGQPDNAAVFVFGSTVDEMPFSRKTHAPIALGTSAPMQSTGMAAAQVVVDVQALLMGDGQETRETAAAYYLAIDPDSERLTLNDWLFVNCMDAEEVNFGADRRARYTNNFDLGFGRDMFMQEDCSEPGDKAFVVINYGSLESAAKTTDPILAVAMEWSPSEPFVKFYTYAPSGDGDFARVLSANFDGRGEKYVPGSCVACHGGRVDVATIGTNPDTKAIFIPWDIESLLFSDTDPSFTDTVTRPLHTKANVSPVLRDMNLSVHDTFADNDPVKELVEGWYGGTDFPSATFDEEYIPLAWQAGELDEAGEVIPDIAPILYASVVAQNCRACHTLSEFQSALVPSLASYASFRDNLNLIAETVVQEGNMPFARLTMDRFWSKAVAGGGTASDALLAHLVDAGEIEAGQSVGAPVASISGQSNFATPENLSSTVLDGRQSSYATAAQNAYLWEIVASPDGSNAALVGESNPQAAIMYDGAGDYTVQLTVTNAVGATDSASVDIVVNSLAPTEVTDKPRFQVSENAAAFISGGFLEFEDADNLPSEVIYTVISGPGFGDISDTLFSQQQLNDGMSIEYSHGGAENEVDSIAFSVSDGTTTLSPVVFDIYITLQNDIPVVDFPTVVPDDNFRVMEGESKAITNLDLRASDDDLDQDLGDLRFDVTVPPSKGTLNLAAPPFFLQSDLLDANRQPVYQHLGDQVVEGDTDQFTFSVTDSADGTLPDQLFVIDLLPVNDAPVVSVRNLMIVEDDGPTSFRHDPDNGMPGGLVAMDPDPDGDDNALIITIMSLPASGVLTIDDVEVAVPATITQGEINLDALKYEPAQDFNGEVTFEFVVSEPGPDGETTLSETFTVIVMEDNDFPTVAIIDSLSVNYGASAASINEPPNNMNNRIMIMDPDLMPNDPLLDQFTVEITASPAYGSLTDGMGNDFNVGDNLSVGGLNVGLLKYKSDVCSTEDPEVLTCQALADWSIQREDGTSDTFSFTVTDLDGLTSAPATFTINLTVGFEENVNKIFPLVGGQGCASGACHDRAPPATFTKGFRLNAGTSTADIDANFDELTTELLGPDAAPLGPPIINPMAPTQSPLLVFPNTVAVVGGHPNPPQFSDSGNTYLILLRWIEESCIGPNGQLGCTP